ncbi:hypothetical protein [Terribacillus saccharophilus]|uniref:hypothetical protein n=1 Tax=Terribacillus saccharophilus TaxID=361277 RepID=UPI003D2C4E74
MKNRWVRVLSVLTVVALFTSLIAPFSVKAKSTESTSEEQKIKEAAEQLEFVFEEAATKDSDGNIISLDIEKIEQKYGSSPELEKVKKDQEAFLQNPTLNTQNCGASSTLRASGVILPIGVGDEEEMKCFEDGVKSFFVDLVPTTALTTAYQYILDKDYTGAAKKLIKAGAKGSIYGIAGTLTWIGLKCRLTN